MMASQKFLILGTSVVVGAAAIAMIAEALLWAHVHAPAGAAGPSGFYLLSPPTVAVTVAGNQLPRFAAEEVWPRESGRR